MPYISTEALVGGAILVGLALGYQYIPLTSSVASGTSSGSSKKKNKNKKKSGKGSSGQEGLSDNVESIRQETLGKGKGAHGSLEQPGAKVNGDVNKGQASSAPSSKPKTLAQKLAPQPRKTKVDE